MSIPKHLLVATDFGDCSRSAVDVAIELAQALRAELTIVHVWQITPLVAVGIDYSSVDLITPAQAVSRAQLDAEVARVREKVPAATGVLRVGVAWDEILRQATEASCDLIVLGTHGRTGIGRALVGSVAEHVIRSAPVPVISVRHSASARRIRLGAESASEAATA